MKKKQGRKVKSGKLFRFESVWLRTALCLLWLCLPGLLTAQQSLSFRLEKVTLKQALQVLKEESGVNFVYNTQEVDDQVIVSGEVKDESVEGALAHLLEQTPYVYERMRDYFLIKKGTKTTTPGACTLRGVVQDEQGRPIPGVTILIKGTTLGTASDMQGNFALTWPAEMGKPALVFSFIGMKTQEIIYDGQSEWNIVMVPETTQMEEVVVTGMFTRKAESFTGSAKTFRKEALMNAGNQNVLQSLKNLDPAFRIVESMEFGSDPNRMPEIQLRGQNSFPNLKGDYSGNPNQPLFILDGFETTIEKVYDLDMNRVESVTILKDAAAKAIYGSKAGNGVVVIETIRPKSGELRISYTGSLEIEAPDLTGYNLMNAAEKLQFEKEHGMYKPYGNASTDQQIEERYQALYTDVLQGVDTYWLSQPLHTGVGQKHSLNFEGGDSRVRYAAGISYNQVTGVMKGSDRNTLNLNTTLSYSYKNLIFRNTLDFTRNWSDDSPYGSFSEYAVLNPYWRPRDESGNPTFLLATVNGIKYYNPLYNATLNTKLESEYTEILDNFNVEWTISPAFKGTGSFSYRRNVSSGDVFYPSGHTMFADYDEEGFSDRKGKYTKTNGISESIQVNAGMNFNETFREKHLLFANLTFNMSSTNTSDNSFTAEGFGNDQMDDISFAIQYEENGTPSGSEQTTHELGFIGALNYSYADRYLFDASYRLNASSVYGADNRWGSFWSLGIGWNLHYEEFMSFAHWLNQFKLRASMGYTGTQNFNPYQAMARYSFGNISYDGKFGASLMGLPNTALQWQKNMDYNMGVDAAFWNNRVNLTFDYYISRTDNLLSDISIPPSLGFTTYKENMGEIENRGVDLSLSVTPWRNDKQRGWLTINVSALHNNNKIKKIYDIFSNSNNEQNEEKDGNSNEFTTDSDRLTELREKYTRPSTLYYEGQSMTAIWGVRSAGIDPMTGKEMFYDKNGQLTAIWSSEDQVVIGDSNPKWQGNLGLNLGYKGFTLSVACTYKLGGDLYNSTLVDKVENVSGYDNLDKRIWDSWNEVGQKAPYRKLDIENVSINLTKPTSRFVQKENELYISTLNLAYDFYDLKFMQKIGMERLTLTFYMNELLRASSVEVERGTSYPFARNFSFSLQATF